MSMPSAPAHPPFDRTLCQALDRAGKVSGHWSWQGASGRAGRAALEGKFRGKELRPEPEIERGRSAFNAAELLETGNRARLGVELGKLLQFSLDAMWTIGVGLLQETVLIVDFGLDEPLRE